MTWFGYTPAQWALFFFLYSFLGWIWESGYVSLREKRWMNRGFLNGPLLPIYGFGAVFILLFTLPVAANPLLVFLMGMAGATLLEYVTGSFLENTFHVRYWDYSMYRWNLHGHICLAASLCWGGVLAGAGAADPPAFQRLGNGASRPGGRGSRTGAGTARSSGRAGLCAGRWPPAPCPLTRFAGGAGFACELYK